ncbi:MAG: acyl-CoA dehydrogenase family protein [Chloroflexota bacterium]|nr:acyl-CoA dehydrogenase family protein [Chloroflexota bacterium]
MKISWPTEQIEKRHALIEAVRLTKDDIETHFKESEEQGHLSQATADALLAAGLLGLKLPLELGGAEADPVTQMMVISELASIDTSAAWCTMVSATNVGSAGAFLPDRGIEQVFKKGNHPMIAGVGMPFGEAKKVDESSYEISGKWPYGSGIKTSSWVTAGAKVSQKVNPIEIRAILSKDQVQIIENWDVSGLRGSGSNDFAVESVRIPEYMTWTGDDSPKRGGYLYNIQRPAFVVFGHTGIALGTARRALKEITSFSQDKARRWPGQNTISSNSIFQSDIAQLDLKLRAMNALATQEFEEVWQYAQEGKKLSEKDQAKIRAVGSWVTKESLDIVTKSFQYAGGTALNRNNSLQQCFRDMYAAAQHFMVSGTHFESYGNEYLKS